MVRILNFISGRNLGGSKQAFLDYSIMCHQLGHQVHSMIRTGSPLKELLEKLPAGISDHILEVNYIRSTLPGLKQWALREFSRATANLSPEVVLVHKPIDLWFIKQVLPDAKVVAVVHSFTAKHLHHANRVFAVSDALKKYLQAAGCRPPVAVINNAIDIPPRPLDTVSRTVPVIGTMAVFRRTKRLDLLIQAFSLLKQQGIIFKGIIAGAGIQKVYLRYLIRVLGLSDLVELRSWVRDKELFFRDIDIFCISSRSETFSISLIEAMARKKSVVATACGGPNEIIEDQVDGLLTPVGDEKSLAKHLSRLASSRELRDQLAAQAYEKVQRCYSTEVVKMKINRQLTLLVNGEII